MADSEVLSERPNQRRPKNLVLDGADPAETTDARLFFFFLAAPLTPSPGYAPAAMRDPPGHGAAPSPCPLNGQKKGKKEKQKLHYSTISCKPAPRFSSINVCFRRRPATSHVTGTQLMDTISDDARTPRPNAAPYVKSHGGCQRPSAIEKTFRQAIAMIWP